MISKEYIYQLSVQRMTGEIIEHSKKNHTKQDDWAYDEFIDNQL